MLSIEHLAKSYGDLTVLSDLNLNVNKGEIYALLGKNGSGKSTTIRILSNLLNFDKGNILFNGKPLDNESKYKIGIVPQENSVYNNLNFYENLKFFGSLYGLSGKNLNRRIDELFEIFGFHLHKSKRIAELSGGWKRRINLAIAMIHDPELLILDEPTAGLDIEIRNELWILIGQLKKMNIAVLLTTHILEEAENLCDRIGILHDGRICAEGSIEELKTLIPASKIAIIETPEPEKLIERVTNIGWQYRNYGKRLNILLPKDYHLSEIINFFNDVVITSIAKRDVSLEHIYYEIVQKE